MMETLNESEISDEFEQELIALFDLNGELLNFHPNMLERDLEGNEQQGGRVEEMNEDGGNQNLERQNNNNNNNEAIEEVQNIVNDNYHNNQALIQISNGVERMERYGVTTHVMSFRIRDIPTESNAVDWTLRPFREVYDKIKEAGGAGHNLFCLSFAFRGLDVKNIHQTMRPIRDYDFNDLWKLVNSVCQSAGGFNVTNTFEIKLHVETM
ncbi:uncharacterized protein LOC130675164 [Microplitis mediator]|uniref:uncharacterized protein LOC130675164 n=1 Tax=Microplitis mediator TaxID=375433 RepID=UPI0025548F76|nr:uncharacterized protein LOC130675164 [Microplitis mediator]